MIEGFPIDVYAATKENILVVGKGWYLSQNAQTHHQIANSIRERGEPISNRQVYVINHWFLYIDFLKGKGDKLYELTEKGRLFALECSKGTEAAFEFLHQYLFTEVSFFKYLKKFFTENPSKECTIDELARFLLDKNKPSSRRRGDARRHLQPKNFKIQARWLSDLLTKMGVAITSKDKVIWKNGIKGLKHEEVVIPLSDKMVQTVLFGNNDENPLKLLKRNHIINDEVNFLLRTILTSNASADDKLHAIEEVISQRYIPKKS